MEDSSSIRVLTRFELRCDGIAVELPLAAQRILALLAIRDRREPRSVLATVLWPDTTEHRAAANLRTALWKLGRRHPPVVRTTRTHVSLNGDVDIDVAAVVGQARRLIGPGDVDERDLDPGPLTSDLLIDWDEEWLVVERERLRQLRLHALEALAHRLSGAGRHAGAVEAALMAVSSEPLRESAQRALISAHLSEGNVSEALQQHRSYTALLWSEIGIRPSDELDALVADFVGGARSAAAHG